MNKPPILSEDELLQAVGRHYSGGSSGLYRAAKAQRDSDIAWLYEWVEQMVIPYMRGSYYYSGAEGFKQQVLALLRGDNETIS